MVRCTALLGTAFSGDAVCRGSGRRNELNPSMAANPVLQQMERMDESLDVRFTYAACPAGVPADVLPTSQRMCRPSKVRT